MKFILLISLLWLSVLAKSNKEITYNTHTQILVPKAGAIAFCLTIDRVPTSTQRASLVLEFRDRASHVSINLNNNIEEYRYTGSIKKLVIEDLDFDNIWTKASYSGALTGNIKSDGNLKSVSLHVVTRDHFVPTRKNGNLICERQMRRFFAPYLFIIVGGGILFVVSSFLLVVGLLILFRRRNNSNVLKQGQVYVISDTKDARRNGDYFKLNNLNGQEYFQPSPTYTPYPNYMPMSKS